MNRRAFMLGVAIALLGNVVAVALRSYAEAAFIAEHGAARLPWLLVANAAGFAAATLGYDAITRRSQTRAVDPVLVIALGIAAAGAPPLLGAGVQPIVLVVALTALSQVAGLALWNRVAASVGGRDARRMLPRAGAAVTAGGAFAGLTAGAVIPRLGASALPYTSAVVAVAILVVAGAQQRALDRGGAPGAAIPSAPDSAAPAELGELYRQVLRWLVAAAVLEAAVATIADLQFAAAIKERYPDAVAVAVALFYGGTNLVLLLLQATAVPRVLVTRSLTFTATLHPILVGFGYAAIAALPGFGAIAGTRTTEQVLRGATSRPAQETALSALPPAPRARWKVLLRGVAWPAGAAAAALALLAVGPTAVAHPKWLGGMAIVVALPWLVAARTAARRFQVALAAPLGIRAARTLEDARRIEVGALERWTLAAGDADPRTAAIARAALDHARVDPSDLADHLRHDDASVRVAMFDQLARAPTRALRNELRVAIAIEDDDRALAAAIKALACAGDDSGIARGKERAGLAREVDEAVATATLALRGGDVLPGLPALCGRDAPWAAAMLRARRTIAPVDDAALAAVLQATAANDGEAGDATVRSARGALVVIARVGPDAALPALDRALSEGAPSAAAAITDLDAEGAAFLAARITALSTRARIGLARALAGAPAAGELVGALLADPDPEVAYAALRTALATARAGGALTEQRIDAAHAGARATLVAYLDARDGATAWSATARTELEVATRRCVARLLWAGAVEAAVDGGDPAPLAATARHLTRGSDAERKRALDVAQELLASRGEVLAVIERWLRPAAPSAGRAGAEVLAALAAADPWLAALASGAHAALEPALVALRRATLFASVAGPALAELAARAEQRTVAGPLFAAGDAGETMFVVITGTLVARRASGPERAIAPGGVVGELAVLTHAPRAASVAAGPEGAEVLVIDRAAFLATSRRAPELVLGLSATLAGWIAPGRADVLP